MDRTIERKLAEPFPPEAVSWRVGSTNSEKTKGMALAYINARDVQQRLDDVFGVMGWQVSFEETPSGRIIATISVYDYKKDCWISKSDGAGDTDFEGVKGGMSDALKRAAVQFGIGRYLYNLGVTWVEVEQKGRSTFIKKSELPKLQATLPSLVDTETLTTIKELLVKVYGDKVAETLPDIYSYLKFNGETEDDLKWLWQQDATRLVNILKGKLKK